MTAVARQPAPAPPGPARTGSIRQAPWWLRHRLVLLLVLLTFGLAAGGVLRLAGLLTGARLVWSVTTGLGMVPATWWVLEAFRRRRLGADTVALLALVGALVVREPLAGAVIAVMLATGRALEAAAAGRAQRELAGLLERAPHEARRVEDGTIATVPLDVIRPGDLVLVRPGEVVPVDGTVEGEPALLDESALTGESIPVPRGPGDPVRSGSVDAGGPVRLRVTTTAADSTYAGIVRLVREANAQSAPFVRLADRFAGAFLGVSLLVAVAAWLSSGQLVRAVAVLVVATPCPLILAAPVAIVSGLSKAALRGVVVKGGAVLERLAACRVLLLDKTGTLTTGRPAVSGIVVAPGFQPDEVLRLAASLDQVSPHVLAASVVQAARARGLPLVLPRDVEDVPGQGVRGTVAGTAVSVGRGSWVGAGPTDQWVRAARRRAELDGGTAVFVSVGGRAAGALLLRDRIRPDAARTVRSLRRNGMQRIVLVSGDRQDVAETVGAVIGVDEVLAERTPAEKVDAVRYERRRGPVVMVGDGINDAPALALADVGVAVGARGATASSEAADVVLVVDRLDRLGEAAAIARRSRAIARQAAAVGVALSAAAMGVAAAGRLAPVWGAIAQEGIDVAAIALALRALGRARGEPRLSAHDAALARRFSAEHRAIRDDVERLRAVADALGTAPPLDALARVREVHRVLVEEVQPHEEAEDAVLYPMLARVVGGTDPLGTMSRAHAEIAHHIRRLGRLLDGIGPEGPDETDLTELRRTLYGLYAVLDLHTTQEDEGYLSFADEPAGADETIGGWQAPVASPATGSPPPNGSRSS